VIHSELGQLNEHPQWDSVSFATVTLSQFHAHAFGQMWTVPTVTPITQYLPTLEQSVGTVCSSAELSETHSGMDPTGGSKKEEDVTLPRATINKLIREALPDDVKCTAETQKLILQCCMEFLQLVSSEANDVCREQNKKMISPEHIVSALQKLGFQEYITDVRQVYEEHKRNEANKPKMSKKLEDSGLPREELLRQQQELFARAKSALSQKQQQPSLPPGSGGPSTKTV